MGLRADLVGAARWTSRFTYDRDPEHAVRQSRAATSLNSRGRHRRTIREEVEAKARTRSAKVYAIVNYDNFTILPELLDAYSAMVRGLVDRYYSGVSRYTTSGFLRMKLGEALTKRGVSPHIFENAAQARKDWREETK